MDKKVNKYIYSWVIWTNYGYGWSAESVYPKTDYKYADVVHDLKGYREAGAKAVIKNRRELNPDYEDSRYLYHTSEELWKGFVDEFAENGSGKMFGSSNVIEKRCWFADWTDQLATEGLISREMADSVSWDDRSNPYR